MHDDGMSAERLRARSFGTRDPPNGLTYFAREDSRFSPPTNAHAMSPPDGNLIDHATVVALAEARVAEADWWSASRIFGSAFVNCFSACRISRSSSIRR